MAHQGKSLSFCSQFADPNLDGALNNDSDWVDVQEL